MLRLILCQIELCYYIGAKIVAHWWSLDYITTGCSCEVTDQDMLAPDCSLIQPDCLGKEGLNLVLGLVTSCCSRQTVCLRPACCWLRWWSMSICDATESQYWSSVGLYKNCGSFNSEVCNTRLKLLEKNLFSLLEKQKLRKEWKNGKIWYTFYLVQSKVSLNIRCFISIWNLKQLPA